MIDTFARDLRYEARQLYARPGFTAAVVLTLILGIGFVTTLFTMINGIAFSKLPFPESHRIVTVGIPASQYDDYARQRLGMESLAFFRQITANMRVKSFAARDPAVIVSANFFDVLPARAAVGRTFAPADGEAAAGRSVVVGHNFWLREFRGDAAAVGSVIELNGQAHTVIGVMPPGFAFPFNQQIWIVRRAGEEIPDGMVFGRLLPDASVQKTAAQFMAFAASIASASGVERQAPAAVQVQKFTDSLVKNAIRIMLMAILGATFLVLILACANVTNLVLARAVDRRKELAIRAALGADRGRLIRQMLTENLLLITFGTLGGVAVAWASTRVIWNYMIREGQLTGGVPYWMSFSVDGRVLSFVVTMAVLCSLLTGLLPALQISRVDLNDALKDGSRGGLRLSRLTRVLVNAQMAFSVCLVTVAGFFLAILFSYSQKSLPYDPAKVLTAQVALEEPRYDSEPARAQLFEDLVSRLASSPGVQAAGLNSSQSLRSSPQMRVELEGQSYSREQDRHMVIVETVSHDFFEVMNTRPREGRAFAATDRTDSLPVALVNTEFVERVALGREVLGRRFRIAGTSPENDSWVTIVGVVPEVGSMKAGQSTRGPQVYRPLAQVPGRTMTVLIRTNGDATLLSNILRREVALLDAELPVSRIQTVSEILELERIGMNAFGSLFVLCGLGALALATVGIYGVVAFSVRMRTREFGVRLALGATPAAIVRLVMTQGLRQIAIGLGIGVLLALAASAALSTAVEGFTRSISDAWIYTGVASLLGAVGAAALAIPAIRGSRVDPMVALRAE